MRYGESRKRRVVCEILTRLFPSQEASDEEEYEEMPTEDMAGDDEGDEGDEGGGGKDGKEKKKKKGPPGSQTGGRVLPLPKKVGSKKKEKK